jgi:hypothetical protein
VSSEFLCQDLEAKLFNWFAGRLNASIIKRSGEMSIITKENIVTLEQLIDTLKAMKEADKIHSIYAEEFYGGSLDIFVCTKDEEITHENKLVD